MLDAIFSLPGYSGDLVLFLARLIIGLIFIYFGWPKIKDLKANARDFVGMGFRPGWLWGTLIAFLEFFGSIALILGVYIWFVAPLMAVHMATGTVWKITKAGKPFPDWSYDLLIMALALILFVFGGGGYGL